MSERSKGKLIRAGDLVKALIPTPAQEKLLNASADIRLDPDSAEAAFLARQLVQCTLPHRDPGDLPVWTRTNGSLTLVIARTGYDETKNQLIGFPYGSIPRLLLFWITTEAVRKKSRELQLGHSLSRFMRDVGLNPRNGSGERSDAHRLRVQMDRLFSSSIHFQQSLRAGAEVGKRVLDMRVTTRSELWWNPKRPGQDSLWNSWIELGEHFYEAITSSTVPLDMRALRALKSSPLALDLYSLLNYRAFVAGKHRTPQIITWGDLQRQLGADYGDQKDLRKRVSATLLKIKAVLPGLAVSRVSEGLIVGPDSKPAIAQR